jgi:V/A-type H+-transporting ATPase subunit F
MRIYLISDNTDSLIGMRLAGIEGEIAHTREEVLDALKRTTDNKDTYGIILLTYKLKQLCNDYLSDYMKKNEKPLFLEIPDRHSAGRPDNSINKFIEESIGLKI